MTVSLTIDHRHRAGAVRDQGPRPTCLAHAATSAHQAARAPSDELSPEFLHYFATGNVPALGASFSSMASALAVEGQPLEIDCPYHSNTPSPHWSPTPAAQVFRRASEPTNAVTSDVEVLLRRGATAVLGLTIPDPFFAPQPP